MSRRHQHGHRTEVPFNEVVGWPLPALDRIQWENRNGVLVPTECPAGVETYCQELLLALQEQRNISFLPTDLSVDHGDLVDLAVNDINQNMARAKNDSQAVHLGRIETALRLMAIGWDGRTCLGSGCGKTIPEERRSSVPGTMLCAQCKGNLERERMPTVVLVHNQYHHCAALAAA